MSKQTDKSLFILPSMPRLYQQILSGVASYEALGNRIIRRIRRAHAFRDLQQVCELAAMLQNFPIKEYQLIGSYYIVWCKCRQLEYDIEALERIIDQSDTYKAKALLSRAAFEGYKGNTNAELFFYNEALKAFPTISERIDILRAIAVVKAKEGFHKLAIKDLESLITIIRHADALVYFDFLNSYAVEIGEAGRIHEARNISQIVIHSPFAFAYPEWQGTANDLKGLNRSFVAFKPFKDIPRNVLPRPVREHEAGAQQGGKPAQVMSLQKWKAKMVKDKKDEPELKDVKDILMWMMNTYTDDETSDHERYRMYEAMRKIIAERNNPKPDDDDTGGA
jgi:tetratricopeptide (TPR) repeat protein